MYGPHWTHTTASWATVFLALLLSGCGGGGGGSPRVVADSGPGPAAGLQSPSRRFHGCGGDSREHGNVVVTCPLGGNACMVSVMADGTVVYDRRGGVPTVTPIYEPWGLPVGHGLRAGVVTVAAGDSREHGNVVVTCPPGGAACRVRVSADGTTSYAVTGAVPAFTYVHPTHERDNPTAEDLLDHWNEPEQLRAALGLSPVDPARVQDRARALSELIGMAGGNPAETGTELRNVRPR